MSDEAIMQATQRALGCHGPANLTLAAVAGEVGLAPATLVQRFGSKRGLLLAFARYAANAVPAAFQYGRQAHNSPLAALYAALANLTSGMQTPAALANNLGFLQMDLTDPQFRDLAVAQTQRMREELVRLIDDAVAAGELTEDVDVPRLARSIQVTYHGVLIYWALTEDGSLAEALCADIGELLRPYQPGRC